jgi:indolepyruvate ferredoxin oxidoreductase beta subunit
MKQHTNILIAGVGGQGILFASGLLSDIILHAGYDIKKSEVHGMAQRGGVVSSHVRFGKKIYSPLIPEGKADIILAFEPAEAIRWIHFIKKNGSVLVNENQLRPPIASIKGYIYPSQPINTLKNRIDDVISVHADALAEKLGNVRIANMILLGMLSRKLDIQESIWIEYIPKRVPEGTATINQKAFQIGRDQV